MRPDEQRMLEHASRGRIDSDRDALDRRRRGMRFKIEQEQGPERPHVADR
jgi:hypothetical protein